MKRLRNAVLIIGSIAFIAAIGFVIYSNVNVFKKITVEARDIESITLVNNELPSYGQAKLITKPDDIKAICDVLNATNIDGKENWNGQFKKRGGTLYTFRFNYSSGTTKVIDYYDGDFLVMDGIAYRIQSFAFNNFWQLNYPIQKWNAENNLLEPLA